MKRLGLCIVAAAALLIGGSATVASAQEAGDPEVSVDNATPEAGGTINVTVSNIEAGTAVTVSLGGATAEGVAGDDEAVTIAVQVPSEPGDVEGTVSVNGVDLPFSVSVQAAAGGGEGEGEGEGEGGDGTSGGSDGTPQPTVVNTGDLGQNDNSLVLFAAAAFLLMIAGGALTIRHRSAES